MQQFHGAAMTDIILRHPVQREDLRIARKIRQLIFCARCVAIVAKSRGCLLGSLPWLFFSCSVDGHESRL
jgi:hypothetical protein